MEKTAVITGAGSGVGAAIAIALAKQGWRVALLGRRREPLETVAAQCPGALVIPCDVGSSDDVAKMGQQVLAEFGSVEVLVNAAGTNVPHRALEVLTLPDYHEMMNANLNGAYYCVQAFLPQMRSRGSGTVINIVSDAGKAASPKAGPGYVISKFGMAGLTSAINAEERTRGVRACAIFPGDIDTPILAKRPVVPDATARAKMMQPEDIAECALLAINLPSRVIIEEMIVRPR
ncbi:MAG: SDR family NAD(P)-dependent oxidoreductase [Chthoniobacter sp.]|uniref:SDR family oxidoreductase n=1 Tax=Chthoniobacter sp. TaxID=2510640 RepID=UPI0032A9A71F